MNDSLIYDIATLGGGGSGTGAGINFPTSSTSYIGGCIYITYYFK